MIKRAAGLDYSGGFPCREMEYSLGCMDVVGPLDRRPNGPTTETQLNPKRKRKRKRIRMRIRTRMSRRKFKSNEERFSCCSTSNKWDLAADHIQTGRRILSMAFPLLCLYIYLYTRTLTHDLFSSSHADVLLPFTGTRQSVIYIKYKFKNVNC